MLISYLVHLPVQHLIYHVWHSHVYIYSPHRRIPRQLRNAQESFTTQMPRIRCWRCCLRRFLAIFPGGDDVPRGSHWRLVVWYVAPRDCVYANCCRCWRLLEWPPMSVVATWAVTLLVTGLTVPAGGQERRCRSSDQRFGPTCF